MALPQPIQMQPFLTGVRYPASRKQLIEYATKLGAGDAICAALAQLPDADFPTPAAVSAAFMAPGAGEFLIQAMEDSLAEMELCMIALDNAGSDEIRHLAHTMLNEHARLGQQIETLVQRMQVPFPKKIRPEHAALISRMAQLTGDAFDSAFMEQTLRYYENDLKVFEHYAALQDGGEVSVLAQAGARAFGRHLGMLKALQQQGKG